MKEGPILSFVTRQALANLGRSVRTARLRRGESETLAAQRAGVSRPTWQRLEQGNPAVSLGLAMEALRLYGFSEQLFALGDPAIDAEGEAKDAARRPKRGSRARTKTDTPGDAADDAADTGGSP
jgi:transcriptional regulator with XRE-family HTH domain